MPIYSTTCLYSTVKNTSGVTKTFSFLPPHGRTLDEDDEFSVFGDIRQALGGNQGSEHSVKNRDRVSFEQAIARGDLQILQTPSPILIDLDTEESQMLELDGGVLSAVDPCWLVSIG